MTGSAQNGGVMEGTISYDWEKHGMIYNFDSNKYVELFRFNEQNGVGGNFTKQVVFQSAEGAPCGGTCQVSSVNAAMPPLGFAPTAAQGFQSNGKTITVSGILCNGFASTVNSDNKNHATAVYMADDGTPCRLDYRNGRILTFTQVNMAASLAFNFAEPVSCVCQRQLDIVMLLDGSSSISAGEWTEINSWVRQAIPKFNFQNELSALSIVQFSAAQEIMLPFTTDIEKLNAYMKTDIPKHLKGTDVVPALALIRSGVYPNRRAGAVTLLITVTDGADRSKPDVIYAEILKHVDMGVSNFISVYIGPNASSTRAQMLGLANQDATRTFDYSDYSAFSAAVDDIINAACEARIQDQDCGSACCGFCMCSTCVSPLKCDDGSLCTSDELVKTSTAGLSCCARPKKKACTPKDKCHSSVCDESNGQCVDTDVSTKCPLGDACQTASCDPAFGCQLKCGTSCSPTVCDSSSCDDGNVCTNDEAIKDGTGATVDCKYTTITCPSPNKCQTDLGCDPKKGCQLAPLDVVNACDDFNVCTDDSCDDNTGCVHTPKNETLFCDDNNGCTIDSCDATRGCVSTLMKCPNGKKCSIGVCKNGKCDLVKPGLCTEEAVAVGLGTAAVVGIIVGVVVALCLGGVAAYKGIEAYNASKDLDNSGLENPLYEQGAIEGSSQIYGRKTYEQY